MKRSIETWRDCAPQAMATEQSEAARTFAFQDARADILELAGTNAVLVNLLHECQMVLKTIEPESTDERVNFDLLLGAIDRAIDPSRHMGSLL